MSKIKLEQISENEVEVILSPDTPMEMVQELTKGLSARGLVEDLEKSTVGVRNFKRPTDKANTVADELIKSLQKLTKDELPYWHPKSQMANQKRVREMEIGERRAKLGIKQPTNVSPAPEPHVVSDIKPAMPAPAAPQVNTLSPTNYTKPHTPLVDNNPAAQMTANGTGRRYATINDPVAQSEHVEGCQCDKCLEMKKSGYGPKGAGQYTPADNVRRKANNVGDVAGEGPNVNVKSYSTKPGQPSGKQSADLTSRIQSAANKKQPVKQWSQEEIAAENAKRGLKKGAWADHLPFPNAEEEMSKIQKHTPQATEEMMAQQLANLMNGKAMLGNTPPAQPTDEEMFGGGVVTEEMAKAAEQKWGNTFNNWMVEAQKPIEGRFRTESEELEYWKNIKVSDRDDGQSGY